MKHHRPILPLTLVICLLNLCACTPDEPQSYNKDQEEATDTIAHRDIDPVFHDESGEGEADFANVQSTLAVRF